MREGTGFIDVAGARAHYCVRGSGPLVLLLHGVPDHGEMWSPVIERLHGRYCCLTIDLPGLGRSVAAPDYDCKLESMARFVAGALDALDVKDPLHLAVHDYGGFYGNAFASVHPERLRSLAITNTIFQGDYRWHFWARVWRTPLAGELSALVMRYPIARAEMRRGSPRIPEDHVRNSYALLNWSVRKMILKHYRALDPARDLPAWEERFLAATAKLPKRVLWGRRDPYADERFARRFGTDDVMIFPEAGHWVVVEEAEAVAARMAEHFARADAAQGLRHLLADRTSPQSAPRLPSP